MGNQKPEAKQEVPKKPADVETNEVVKKADLKAPTDLYVGQNDVKMHNGTVRKAKMAQPAIEAIEAIEAKPAVEEKRDEKGAVIQKAVPAVKGRKAVPAVPATPDMPPQQTMFIVSPKIQSLREVANRLADQGVMPKFDKDGVAKVTMHEEGYKLAVITPTDNQAMFRAAFKQCKGTGKYNIKGQKIKDAEKKARMQEAKEKGLKKAEEAKAKKEAEEKAKGAAPATTKIPVAPAKK